MANVPADAGHPTQPGANPGSEAHLRVLVTSLGERVVELEMRSAFAEDLVQSLDETVARQADLLDALRASVDRLAAQLQATTGDDGAATSDDPAADRPPHY